MNRIDFPATADEAAATVQGVLASLQKTLGFVPNLHRLMSISPHVLAGPGEGCLSRSGAEGGQ